MTNSLLTALVYAMILSIVATTVATFWSAGPKLRSALLHFAAGVVFAVVATDLLPGIVQEQRPIWVIVGFTAGVVLMLVVRWLDKGGTTGSVPSFSPLARRRYCSS